MAITYLGVTDFTLQSEREGTPIMEVPTRQQVWKGAATKYAAFMAAHKKGTAFDGGYIVDVSGEDRGMYPEITLTIMDPPDFQTYTLGVSFSRKSSSKGATVEASGIIDGASSVEAQRKVTFQAQESVYTYFASSKPSGPRFTNPTEQGTVRFYSSVIQATANGATRTYYGNAPSALQVALALDPVGRVDDHTADPIPGTPWYRCRDVISYGYWGDE